MKKEERLEIIHKRAYEYANSGRFSGWQEIEWKLRKEGLFEARDEIDRPAMRSELDDLCRKARLQSEVNSRESDPAKEENTENSFSQNDGVKNNYKSKNKQSVQQR